MVLNQNPDVTAYRGWQNARLAEVRTARAPAGRRLRALERRAADRGHARIARVNQVFVHSKVVTVDDEWAMAWAAANLDGVSLHSYGDDFTGRRRRRVFRHVRNFDVNIVVDGARVGADAGSVADLRCAAVVGAPRRRAADASCRGPRTAGWRSGARTRRPTSPFCAAAAVPPRRTGMRGFVLPYSVAIHAGAATGGSRRARPIARDSTCASIRAGSKCT